MSLSKNGSKMIIDISHEILMRYFHQSDQIYQQVRAFNEYE